MVKELIQISLTCEIILDSVPIQVSGLHLNDDLANSHCVLHSDGIWSCDELRSLIIDICHNDLDIGGATQRCWFSTVSSNYFKFIEMEGSTVIIKSPDECLIIFYTPINAIISKDNMQN